MFAMETQQKNIKALLMEIRDKIGRPVSNRVVMAAIESCGVREKDIPMDFGFQSLKKLADFIFNELSFSEEYKGIKNIKERTLMTKTPKLIQISDYLWVKAKIFAQYYPLGIFHLLPILIQISSIIIFGYSLWTFIGFNQVQSTAVVLGVVLGLISTSGFVQVIGRQASFYWNHENYAMVKQTVDFLIRTGTISIGCFMMAATLINCLFYFYPFRMLLIAFIYTFLIGFLLLLLAPFHTIKQQWVISLAIFLGTLVAVGLKTFTDFEIYFTHWIGIGVAIITAKSYLIWFFKIILKDQKQSLKVKIKKSVVFYHNYRYFFYGLFLYMFIFMDRILAWSSTMNGSLPYIVFFNKNYELGMDSAILVLLLLSGVLEYGIASFSKFLEMGEKSTSFRLCQSFRAQLVRLYWQQVLIFFGTAALIFVMFYILVESSWGFEAYLNESLNDVILRVGIIGGIGYLFLAWGMLNTLYLFTLGCPTKPLKAIMVASVFNFIIGFICSRFVGYEYSVIGMFFGSVIFMVLTLKANLDFLKKLDYHYYAAY